MRLRRLAVWVSVTTWLVACSGGVRGASPDETTAVTTSSPTTAPPTTSPSTTSSPPSTLPAGVDVRRGVADGDTWVLTTKTTTVDGELCLRLVWEGDAQGWSSCYGVDDGMGAVPWVDPYLSHGDAPIHFVVGLAPLDARTVQVHRGATVLGEADVFPGDPLHLGRLGFALALPVPEAEAIAGAVDVPGLDRPTAIGLLPPMEVVALDADGVEVGRGGRLVGSVVDVPYLVIGDDPATAITTILSPVGVAGGGIMPSSAAPSSYGYVIVPTGATYEVVVGGRAERRALVPIPGTSPPMLLAVAMLDQNDPMSMTFTICDAAGEVVETVPLGQYLGG